MQTFIDWLADHALDSRYDILASLVPLQLSAADILWIVKSLGLPQNLVDDLIDSGRGDGTLRV
jgi:hypothetical protein